MVVVPGGEDLLPPDAAARGGSGGSGGSEADEGA